MSKSDSTLSTPVLEDAIAKGIAAGIGAVTANQPQRVSYAEYRRRHPVPKLAQPTFLHGIDLSSHTRGMSKETIRAVNTIPSGTYLGGVVTIMRNEKGLFIDWPWSDPDQRNRAARAFSSFSDCLQKCAVEAQTRPAA